MKSVPTRFLQRFVHAYKLRVVVPRVLVILFLLINGELAFPQTKVIWEIGSNDKSAREFPQDSRPQLAYDIRTSSWRKDWAATQNCGAPYEITFPVDASPDGRYVLHVSALTYTPVVPALHMDVNGHNGDFYLHPELVR